MNEQRNLVVFIVASVLVYLAFYLVYERPRLERLAGTGTHRTTQTPEARTQEPGSFAPSGAPGETGPLSPPSPALLTREEALGQEPRAFLDGARVRASVRLRGGLLDDVILRNYRLTTDADSSPVSLLSPPGTRDPYYAATGFSSPGGALSLPGMETVWTVAPGRNGDRDPLVLVHDNGQGLRFYRRIEVDDNYLFTISSRVENYGQEEVSLAPWALLSRHGTPALSGFLILHEGPIGWLEGELREYDYSDLDGEEPVRFGRTQGWLGITDKYWLAALLPRNDEAFFPSFSAGTGGGARPVYQAALVSDTRRLLPGQEFTHEISIFAGAKENDVIEAYDRNLGDRRFDLAIDWGALYFLTRPVFWLLHVFHGLTGNFGVAILLLTVVVKLAMFPLAQKSYRSLNQMKALQPEIDRIRKQAGDDRRQMQIELVRLYRREKITPAAGCLPILVQIPVFFSLYKVIFIAIEMRHAPFFGWIQDLSAPDPTTWLNLFGLLPWDRPRLGFLDVLNIGIWPVLMGVTMYLQQRLNPQPPDPVQARIINMLPLIFVFLLGSFASGLVIYWTWNNILSIAQQAYLMYGMRKAGAGRPGDKSGAGKTGDKSGAGKTREKSGAGKRLG